MNEQIHTVVIGGGQAGLATSHCLSQRGVEHVVLERGRVGERWRSERWDSFRLLTPNWHTRLPGHRYLGPDPDGFMARDEIVDFFETYARVSAAPVREGVHVRSVECADGGYRVRVDGGSIVACNVVVATGHMDRGLVPPFAAAISRDVAQVHASRYRNPGALPDGGVLVVGAASSGQQIADELARAGRDVHLAVGRHQRIPRRYRGQDAIWWYDRMGSFAKTTDDVADPAAERRSPSMSLTGADGGRDLDLRMLAASGVTLTGRLAGADGTRLTFADDLAASIADGDARYARFTGSVDAFVREHGLVVPASDVDRSRWSPSGPGALDLRASRIGTVIWATGYRRRYDWLHLPVFGHDGEAAHRRGVTNAPGCYFVGLRFQWRRDSNFIDGVGADAAFVAAHIAARAAGRVAA